MTAVVFDLQGQTSTHMLSQPLSRKRSRSQAQGGQQLDNASGSRYNVNSVTVLCSGAVFGQTILEQRLPPGCPMHNADFVICQQWYVAMFTCAQEGELQEAQQTAASQHAQGMVCLPLCCEAPMHHVLTLLMTVHQLACSGRLLSCRWAAASTSSIFYPCTTNPLEHHHHSPPHKLALVLLFAATVELSGTPLAPAAAISAAQSQLSKPTVYRPGCRSGGSGAPVAPASAVDPTALQGSSTTSWDGQAEARAAKWRRVSQVFTDLEQAFFTCRDAMAPGGKASTHAAALFLQQAGCC